MTTIDLNTGVKSIELAVRANRNAAYAEPGSLVLHVLRVVRIAAQGIS
jgi:hypothetical protein